MIKRERRKRKRMNHLHQFFTQKLISSEKSNIKIPLFFSTKLNKSVHPFGYLNQYSCKVKMALIIASIIISKTRVVSLHIKVHEVYVKPLKTRPTIEESDDKDSDNEEQDLKNIIKNISDSEDLD